MVHISCEENALSRALDLVLRGLLLEAYVRVCWYPIGASPTLHAPYLWRPNRTIEQFAWPSTLYNFYRLLFVTWMSSIAIAGIFPWSIRLILACDPHE
jgi:hypothetical protein